jgi:hypothetical protein
MNTSATKNGPTKAAGLPVRTGVKAGGSTWT